MGSVDPVRPQVEVNEGGKRRWGKALDPGEKAGTMVKLPKMTKYPRCGSLLI